MTLDQGANFVAAVFGGVAWVTAHGEVVGQCLRDHVDAKATWLGDSLAVDLSYSPALAEAIIAARFSLERDPLPN